MNRLILIMVTLLSSGIYAVATEPFSPDTTIQVENKRIEIRENGKSVKVKVYQQDEDGVSVSNEVVVVETSSRNTRYCKKWKHGDSFCLSVSKWNRKYNPHWAGFGMGFANFADNDLRINDIDGVWLRSSKSLEYNLNFFETSIPFSRSGFAFVTGVGIRWSRYRLGSNSYFQEINGFTSLHPLPNGVYCKASKLNITSITIPLLLEWQNRTGNKKAKFFLSAGVVGVIKTCSSSKVVYLDERGEKEKRKMDTGMNIRPVTMDILLQAGFRGIGIYAKYSPMGLFESGRGPLVHPVSLGLQLHI